MPVNLKTHRYNVYVKYKILITILLLDEVEYDLKNNITEIKEGVKWLR